MNLNNLTIKSQEAVQSAQQLAISLGHQSIEPAHILKGMIDVDDNLLNYIFKKVNVNPARITDGLSGILNSFPVVSGGNIYLSEESNKLLQKSISLSKTFGEVTNRLQK